MLRCLVCVTLGLWLVFPAGVPAEIVVEGDTCTFVRERPGGDEDRRVLKKVSRFRQEMVLSDVVSDARKPDGEISVVHSLFSVLKRRVVQGLELAVGKERRYAAVLTYHCAMEEVGAEFPFVCRSVTALLDSEGLEIGQAGGNYYEVQIHDRLPYFVLAEHTCCDAPKHAALFGPRGEKLCDIADHRDEGWTSRPEFRCRLSPNGVEKVIPLVQKGRSPEPGKE
jgi:hypothetical protein